MLSVSCLVLIFYDVTVDVDMATIREVIEGWREIKTSRVVEFLREVKTSRVYVDGMPESLSEDDVEKFFSRIGPVRRDGVELIMASYKGSNAPDK